jgi:hypothetical protein
MNATTHADERELAFETLLPLARAIADVLARVQTLLDDERKQISPFRSKWHMTQHASSRGSSRFAHTVQEMRELEDGTTVRLISTPSQMAQNLWLWRLDDRYVLRVKHDLDDIVDPGTATLFSLEPTAAVSMTIFLTWETAADGQIRSVAFASLDEPKWTIPLRELLDASVEPTRKLEAPRPQLNVRSKIVDDNASEQSADG